MENLDKYALNYLPENILINILDDCDFQTLKNIRNSEAIYSQLIDDLYSKQYKDKKEQYKLDKLEKNDFPSQLLKTLPKDVLIKCKKVNIGRRMGVTDYLDIFTKKDFSKSSYIYGYDAYNRFFFSVLLNFQYNNEVYYQDLTIFQRYSDDKNFYVSCKSQLKKLNIVECFNINNLDESEFFQQFLNLLNDKELDNNWTTVYDNLLKKDIFTNVTYYVYIR